MPAAVVTMAAQAALLGGQCAIPALTAVAWAGGLNFVGDSLLCGVFGMGIGGAAVATVASQYAAAYLSWVNLGDWLEKRWGQAESGESALRIRPVSRERLAVFASFFGSVRHHIEIGSLFLIHIFGGKRPTIRTVRNFNLPTAQTHGGRARRQDLLAARDHTRRRIVLAGRSRSPQHRVGRISPYVPVRRRHLSDSASIPASH